MSSISNCGLKQDSFHSSTLYDNKIVIGSLYNNRMLITDFDQLFAYPLLCVGWVS